jgi:hypothetical protein
VTFLREDTGVGNMAGRILRRFITGIEAMVYGPPSLVSGWFRDDPGYGGRDLLADPTPTRGGTVLGPTE